MDRARLLKFLNPGLFLSFVIQAFTGIILFFDWEIFRGLFVFRVHEYNGLLMVFLVVFHLALNWRWVWANFFKKKTTSHK
jgi:hypothetical protein